MKIVIIYSPSSCSKPFMSFFLICWAQKKIFWRIWVTKQLTVAIGIHDIFGLHGLKTEARTRPVPEIVWPNPTRPERHG